MYRGTGGRQKKEGCEIQEGDVPRRCSFHHHRDLIHQVQFCSTWTRWSVTASEESAPIQVDVGGVAWWARFHASTTSTHRSPVKQESNSLQF